MLKFSSAELEQETKECLLYLSQKEKSSSGINLDFFDVLSDKFDPSEYNDVIIDENYEVGFGPDYSEEWITMTLREFINLINETKTAQLKDSTKCITEKRCLVRVLTNNYPDIAIIDILFGKGDKILKTEAELNNIKFSCSLVRGVTIFGIMVNFSDDFDKNFPSVVSDDVFIEIVYSKLMTELNIDKIVNAYIFELSATHKIRLAISPRPDGYFDEVDEEEIGNKNCILRPLLIGKGIDELLKIFNLGEEGYGNYDYSIIQYTKVIEYVSQTVIRQEITSKAQIKLMSPRTLTPDANYIKELENMFAEFKQKYDLDRSALKITIKNCCDIFDIIDCAPKKLEKVIKLRGNIEKSKANREGLLDAAYDQLADSISDTRNYIAHAKANYVPKGNECPEDQKDKFVSMLRILAIQTIRWFSTTNESARIVND